MNIEDTYLKDSIKKCVDYVMSKNDEDKRRIITGMFQYNDYLINEQLVVKALNDKEKQEWFNNDMFEAYDKEIERLNNIINSLEETLNKLIKEQLEQYHKREENWEERRNVSNTWLTSRDCYYSILKYLHELKGVDKE